jgi:hypothetical protein
MRYVSGSVALGAADKKLADMRTEFDRWRPLSISTDGAFGDNASLAGFPASPKQHRLLIDQTKTSGSDQSPGRRDRSNARPQ